MRIFDTHCHLDYLARDADLAAVLSRARTAGVSRVLTIATTLSGMDAVRSAASAATAAGVKSRCTAGVHPHEAESEGGGGVEALRDCIAACGDGVAGVGESGLDYYYNHSAPDVQRRVFSDHIRVAGETGLPLVVHSRDAESDTVAMLREGIAEWSGLRGVIHCFTGGRELLEGALGCDFYVSLSGIVTFRRSTGLRELAGEVPLERLLVETDAPYLSPEPVRGRVNEPANVVHTVCCLAGVRGMEADALAEAAWRNGVELFGDWG